MPDFQTISISDLLLDVTNPRFENEQENQREAIRALFTGQKAKLIRLAKDIQDFGLDPSALVLVMHSPAEEGKYIALEGNRRLAALKILYDSSIIDDLLTHKQRTDLSAIIRAFLQDPIESIDCSIVEDREEARHWIELRHEGQMEGAGIVKWGAAEGARFRQRFGNKEIHLQILDYLHSQNLLTSEERSQVPVTSLRRILEDSYTRQKLEYQIVDGEFRLLPLLTDEQKLAAYFKQIVTDLASGVIRTRDIYLHEDRVSYIDRITLAPQHSSQDAAPQGEAAEDDSAQNQQESEAAKAAEEQPNDQTYGGDQTSGDNHRSNGTSPQEQPTAAGTSETPAAGATRPARTRSRPTDVNRPNLVPTRFNVRIPADRINEIFHELKRLNIADFPNATAVLFRVFLELSIDNYIDRYPGGDFPFTSDNRNYSLYRKYEDVGRHLRTRGKLTEPQMEAVRRAVARDSFLSFTVSSLHAYIHNQYFHPSAGDLRTAWNNVEEYVRAIWE